MKRWVKIGCLSLCGLLAGNVPGWSGVQDTSQTAGEESSSDLMAMAIAAGDLAFESGDYRAAMTAYSGVSPIDIPAGAQNRLGLSYHMLDMPREAEATYRVATVRHRDYAPTYNNIGALFYARGDFKDAENRFRDSLEYDPNDLVVQGNLHAAKYARENSRLVRAEVERLSVENPLLIDATVGETLVVSLLIEPETREELRLLEIRGDVFVARKMFEDAIVEYQSYLDIDEYDAMVTIKLGITYQQTQQISDAESRYRRALRLNPYFVSALNNLGSLEHGRGDYWGALDYYRQALEIEEESSTVLQNVGACLFALERYEEGLVAYVRAIQIDPGLFDRIGGRGGTLVQTVPGNESMASFYFAKLFAGSGDLDRTMSFLYRAVEEGFNDVEMLGDPVFGELRSDDRFVRLVTSLVAEP